MLDGALLEQLPDTLTIEQDGKAIPIKEHPFVKEAKDFPTFVKGAVDAHREVGARVRLPDPKAAKPEDMAGFKALLYEKGIFTAPPAKVEDYGLHVKPEKLPEGLHWNEGAAKELADLLHKHGAPKALAAELVALQQKLLLGNQQTLKTSFDEGIKVLKTEHGDKYEERAEMAGRLAASIFKTPEELKFYEDMGLANHPLFLSPLMRLAPLAMQDSAFIASTGGGEGATDGEKVLMEVRDIRDNKANPLHAGYWKNDPKVMAHIDELYKKAYGSEKVQLS